MKKKYEIILGTARFSGLYGINNNKKILKKSEINSILNYAYKKNIKYLDTAISYKKTNNILKKLNIKKFKILSKLPKLPKNQINVEKYINNLLINHIKQLNIKKLYGLYLHDPNDLFLKNGKVIIKVLKKLKNKKLIQKIGYSVYNLDQTLRLIKIYKPDMIQFPLSIFDKRFLKKNYINMFIKKKIELHTRSIFFQGGLLSNYNNLKNKINFSKKKFSQWEEWLKKNKLNKIRGALSILHKLNKKIKVVVGVESKNQLEEILNEINKKILKPPIFKVSINVLKKIYNYKIKD